MAATLRQTASIRRLPPLPSTRDLIKLYDLRALKEMSQNFLLDERLCSKIIQRAGNITDAFICEVGPGPGSITRAIIRRAPKKLVVVEKDRRFIPTLELLRDACKDFTEMQIIRGDIKKTEMKDFFPEDIRKDWHDVSPPVHLIGNLPFAVSTILVIRWLELMSQQKGPWHLGRAKMTLTFQKEVAERMVAPISARNRCRMSVMCQNWCYVDHKFTIPGKAFIPKPDVDVGIVTLTPLKRPVIDGLPFKMIEKVVRQIFSMRQKYSIRGAQTLFPEECRLEMASRMYLKSDLDPVTRPFQISVEEFGRLCYAYNEIITQYPELEHYNYRARKKPLDDGSKQILESNIEADILSTQVLEPDINISVAEEKVAN